jgi:hypothetical protein
MDYKVVYKETFLADLERFLKSIAEQNPDAARRLGVAIASDQRKLEFLS